MGADTTAADVTVVAVPLGATSATCCEDAGAVETAGMATDAVGAVFGEATVGGADAGGSADAVRRVSAGLSQPNASMIQRGASLIERQYRAVLA